MRCPAPAGGNSPSQTQRCRLNFGMRSNSINAAKRAPWETRVDTPLNASAMNAGAIFSNNMFVIPKFQREYSWGNDEVREFWSDLRGSLEQPSYFLGLLILTKPVGAEIGRKQVVDGQQRLLTVSLLANAIYHEAISRDRKALAERLQAAFLRSIDYDSDEQVPRIELSDQADNHTFQTLLSTGQSPNFDIDPESISARLVISHELITRALREDLRADPFKRLGRWTEFLINRLYFAIFVHPDPESAYQVYEVVNTRGKDLTTADLLKNYLLGQAAPAVQPQLYDRWQVIARNFSTEGANNFVQYIRHVVTVNSGHVLPKNLYGFLAGRTVGERSPPLPTELMRLLEARLPLYLQMIDPTTVGPADSEALGVFSALKSLSVLAVRPILLACAEVPASKAGMEFILRLVVRRIIVGNLGTGNVERRFGEAARAIHEARDWEAMVDGLRDLNPTRDEFVSQLGKRSFNKQVLDFLRRSIIQNSITPNPQGFLHFIWTRQPPFGGMAEDEGSYWASTIGNTLVATIEKRPRSITNWETFKEGMLPAAANGELVSKLSDVEEWNVFEVEAIGSDLASEAGRIWYDD